MANTGILLRKGTKTEFEINKPTMGEIVFATDTNEIGMLKDGSVFWQLWNPTIDPTHLLTGHTIPSDNDFTDGDKYIRVWDNLGAVEITEYKKENGAWREIHKGQSLEWCDANLEPNIHTDGVYPYLGKNGYKMDENYYPQVDLDVGTLEYVQNSSGFGEYVKLDGSNEMQSGYIPTEEGDVITANNMLSSTMNVVVPTQYPYVNGGLWNENGIPRISRGVGTCERIIHKGNYPEMDHGWAMATEGNHLIVGSPDITGIDQAFRKDFITIFDMSVPNYENSNGIKIFGTLGGTQYGTGFGSVIKTFPGSPIWVAGNSRDITTGCGFEIYDYLGTKLHTVTKSGTEWLGKVISMDSTHIVSTYSKVINYKRVSFIAVYDHSGNEITTFGTEYEIDGITPIITYNFSNTIHLQNGIIFIEGTDDNYQTGQIFMFDITGNKLGELSFPPNMPTPYGSWHGFFNKYEIVGNILYAGSNYAVGPELQEGIYLFDLNTNQYKKRFRLPENIVHNDNVCRTFKIYGRYMFVSCASGFEGVLHRGGVFIYNLDGDFIGSISHPYEQLSSWFGYSIEIDPNTHLPIIGAPYHDYAFTDDGAVFIYD